MISNKLRISLLILALMSIISIVFAANLRPVSFAADGQRVQLLNNSDHGFELSFRVHDYNLETISTKAGDYDQLSIEGYGYSNKIGEPQLPVFSRLIAVPWGAEVNFDIYNRKQLTISKADARLEHQLLPVQPSLSKREDPAQAPFQKNRDSYSRNEFMGNPLFAVEEIGMMRAVRVFRIAYSPLSYNPSSGELQINSEAAIRISFSNPDFATTEALMAKTASYEYDNLYAATFLNWDSSTRVSLVRYPTKMLILCPPNYTDRMVPFVEWKKQQGYNVILTTVGSGGTVANTVSAIKTYMTGVWAAATAQDPAPTYLLIVGDTSTSGDNIIASNATVSSPSSDHVTDNYYVRLQGTDYVPEMYQGRFSVSSATELTNIIYKTITFEKTQMTDLSYLGKAVMIAGQDPTYGPTHGDGAIKYGTQNYFNTDHGITSNTYLYAVSGSSDAAIIANANEGRGYINYTAHGSETSWSDPTFTVTNVNNMTNTGKFGVMVGNCCLTNAFDTGVCFGESIIRKANAGGVIYIGGTNSTYWNEDYWWAVGAKGTANGIAPAYNASTLGAYDAMFHTHNEAVTNWATTTGDVIYMGNAAVVQGSSSYQNYYWEIYSIMGDPSLMPYYGVPTANNASYPTQIIISNSTYAITGAAAYSRVGISMNGVIYGSGICDASGNLTLTLSTFPHGGTARLVITAQNKITLIADIPVVYPTGPYLIVDSVS
nr:gingipain R [Candidatus Cloacimonadota bacterium]